MSPLDEDRPPAERLRSRQRSRAVALALALGAFVILLYAISIAKMAIR